MRWYGRAGRPWCRPGRAVRGWQAAAGLLALAAAAALAGCAGTSAGQLSGSAVFPLPAPGADTEYQIVADSRGTLWVAGGPGLTAVDPASGRVTAKLAGYGPPIAFGDGAVWATGAGGTVQRISPATRRPAGPPVRLGRGVLALGAGGGLVWAVIRGRHGWVVARIRAASGRVLGRPARFGVPDPAGDLGNAAITAGPRGAWCVQSAWLASGHGTLVHLDPRSGQPTGRPVSLPADAAKVLVHATEGFGRVWIQEGPRVFAVTAGTGQVQSSGVIGPVFDMAVGNGGVWVLEYARATGDTQHVTLTRLLPGTLRPAGDPVRLDGPLANVVAAPRRAWVITDRIRSLRP
jgi:hypothetical protein